MSQRNFCDLCEKPADVDNGFTSLFLKRDGLLNRLGFHCNVEFSKAKDRYLKTTDARADICKSCLAGLLRTIAANLEGEA